LSTVSSLASVGQGWLARFFENKVRNAESAAAKTVFKGVSMLNFRVQTSQAGRFAMPRQLPGGLCASVATAHARKACRFVAGLQRKEISAAVFFALARALWCNSSSFLNGRLARGLKVLEPYVQLWSNSQ
jgi:hypothetical protein